MRKLLLSGVTLATLGFVPASAADLGVRGQPAPAFGPPPGVSWTGFYVGGNLGYSWGTSENNIRVVGLPPSLFGISTASLARGDVDETDVDGVIGGGQAGFNWQVGSWVVGTESDFQGSSQQGMRATAVLAARPAPWLRLTPRTNCPGSEQPGAGLVT